MHMKTAMSKELNILVLFKFTIHARTIVTPFHSKLLPTVKQYCYRPRVAQRVPGS
jgi:hypothetical protein